MVKYGRNFFMGIPVPQFLNLCAPATEAYVFYNRYEPYETTMILMIFISICEVNLRFSTIFIAFRPYGTTMI